MTGAACVYCVYIYVTKVMNGNSSKFAKVPDIDDADNGLGVEIESSNSCTGNDSSKQFTLAMSLIYYILYFTI